MKAAFLPYRGVVKVAGDGARNFLHGLVTADILDLKTGEARFCALLTPQGKIIADFIVTEAPAASGGRLYLDAPRELATSLVEKLNLYKLRAKVLVEDLSQTLGVLTAWDGAGKTGSDWSYPDPRLPALGMRVMLPPHLAADRRLRARSRDRRCARLRGPSYRAWCAARRARFPLRRSAPSRERHGPAWRR